MFKTLKSNPFIYSNGSITLPTGFKTAWLDLTFHGGQFPRYQKKPNTFGVNLRAEANHSCQMLLPIADYSVPTDHASVVQAKVQRIIEMRMQGMDIYVGCMGGIGRTGLMLALVAKALGAEHPVAYVREHYLSHAVETEEQAQYVDDFDVSSIQKTLFLTAWNARAKRLLVRGKA